MEPDHEFLLFLLDLIDFLLFVFKFSTDFIDLFKDLTFFLSARSKSLGELDIFALHGLEKNEFLEEEDEFHLGVLEIGLKSVFFLLHFTDFVIEGRDELIDLLLLLLFLENELDMFDLSELLINICALSLSVLSGDTLLLSEV